MTPYEILGVEPEADAATIKAAFRSLTQKNHPDKGGSKAIMQQIQLAYDLLSDEAKRAEYDTTGTVEPQASPEEATAATLSEVLATIFDEAEKHGAPENIDLLQHARQFLHSRIMAGHDHQVSLTRQISRRQRQLEVTKWRQEKPVNYLELVLTSHIVSAEKQMAKNERQIEIWRDVLDLLADYEFIG